MFGKGVPLGPICIVLLLLWLASGIFIVKPGEVGVITRFGQYNREVTNGPHYHLPFPVERAEIVNFQALREVVIGQSIETGRAALRSGAGKGTADDSSMFTGDENIVHMRFSIQWDINEAEVSKYLFSVRDPATTVASAAEAAMRGVVGSSKIDPILTSGRAQVQADAIAELNEILKPYDMGVRIRKVQLLAVQPPPEVEQAFKDVASAREEREEIINKAEAYRNKIVPVATGTAQGIVNAALAYKRQVEQNAQGEAERFLALVEEFDKAKEITKKRMYLEAMEDVLSTSGLEKVVISKDATGNLVPLLNLGQSGPFPLQAPAGRAPAANGPAQGGAAQ